ncbi:MAG: hypothetical protein ABJZ55_21265 [Fuerstiella sp.]
MLLAVMIMAVPGCRSSQSFAKLEQELRGREAEIRQLESEIAASEQQLQDQDQQLAAHRMPSADAVSGTQFAMVSQSADMPSNHQSSRSTNIPEEVLAAWGSVDRLQIQKLVSGIQWDSGTPTLHVVIRPVDAEGELCKVAGQLVVRANVVTESGSSNAIVDHTWNITESRDLWTNALVSSGFHARAPIGDLQAAQSARQLIVNATLTLGQGRIFEISETIDLPVQAR